MHHSNPVSQAKRSTETKPRPALPCHAPALCLSLLVLLLWLPAEGAQSRATVLEDFESGAVTLVSHDPAQDLDPDDWEVTDVLAYGGSRYALRLWGNTWKAKEIAPYPITEGTVWQVAAFTREIGEMQGFGLSDGVNTLYYSFHGSQLPTTDPWVVVYQGAFPDSQWNLFLLPVGRDWIDRFGYDPAVTSLIFVNDRDAEPEGEIFFDAVADVTTDLPAAPSAHIIRGRESVEKLSAILYRVGIQFGSQIDDPDTPIDSLALLWDFGDGMTSAEPNPFHEFLVQADYTYTVNLFVRDPQGLWGRDSTQVRVEPGAPELPITMNFVGDVMLARGYDSNGGLIDQHGPEWMFIPTRPYVGDAADLSICNLECPFTDEGVRHPTKSITFRARPSNVTGISYAGFDAVSLGNNHITDYGQRGMEETQEMLDGEGIPWGGADDNEYLALQPVFLNKRGVSLAFLGQCNRTGREYNYQPFLDAGFNKPGFAYEISENIESAISGARAIADLTVIQLHSGIEYATGPGALAGSGWPLEGEDELPRGLLREPGAVGSRYAPPPQPVDAGDPLFGVAGEPASDAQGPDDGLNGDFLFPTRPTLTDRQLRWQAVDDGADLVICHHPHVLQGFEVYNGVLVAHSLGNFVFDQTYAETMPTLILNTTFDKGGFHGITFRPAFVDDWVPQVVTGRLAREILDRQADYSRELGAVVSVDPARMLATIHLHPEDLQWIPEAVSRTVPLFDRDGLYVTPPVERTGPGVLARVLPAGSADGVEVRLGREMVWHGDFENEGATFWDLNSSYETYDETVAHQGIRSLRLRRSDGTSAVTTSLQGYPALLGGLDYSVSVWIKTEDANQAAFTASLYRGRGSSLIATFYAGDPIDGTRDWTYLWQDFHVEQTPWFFNVRARIDRPTSGQETAWFDEARLIAWEGWEPLNTALAVSYPNNYRYVQFRTANAADSLRVSWEDVHVSEIPATAPEETVEPGGTTFSADFRLYAPRPNPSTRSVSLEYRLPRGGRVQLDVFDAAGRRVASLLDEAQPAGTHRRTWSAQEVPSGIYFVRCRFEDGVRTEKVVVSR